MGNVFSLASLREEADKKFAPLEFTTDNDTYVLRSLLRVTKEERAGILAKMKTMENLRNAEGEGEVDEDQIVELVHFILKAVTADRKGAKLCREIGDDLILNTTLLEKWQEATQPGEATDSPV
jgi:hypothetical protein